MDKKAKDLQKGLHNRLERQLQKEENRLCFDCHGKGPRWASMNLGIFLCLRCAGIHRALGVHISKVRSTTMDNWEPQWVEFMEQMGNERAKRVYEAKWTKAVDRPDPSAPDRRLESHVRDKYEHRRWWSDPSLDDAGIRALASTWLDAGGTSPASPASPILAPAAPLAKAPVAPPLEAPSVPKPSPPASAPAAPPPPAEDLLMDFGEKPKAVQEDHDDDFFISAPAKPAAPPGWTSDFMAAPTPTLFPEAMGDFKAAPNQADVRNTILNAFSAPPTTGMGGVRAGPPPLAGHMGLMGGMGGYPQQPYGHGGPMGMNFPGGSPMGISMGGFMGMPMGGAMGSPIGGPMGGPPGSMFGGPPGAGGMPMMAPPGLAWQNGPR